MKNKVKGIIIVILVANLFIGSFALATDGSEMIKVAINSINLLVNGEEVEVDKFVYDGTTYVPVRAVAEMLGKEVGWDGKSQTASINDKKPVTVDEDFMLHGCYAISSYNQFNDFSRSKTLSNFNSISFGWSRIDRKDDELELVFNGKDFYVPTGYNNSLETLTNENISKQLMVYADTYKEYIFHEIFADKEVFIDQIIEVVNGENSIYSMLEFDGVTIDFETVRKDDQDGFVEFLKLLDEKLGEKKLYVAVPSVYYNSYYDFEGIIAVCDYIILMEHDYDEENLKKEHAGDSIIKQPLSPIKKIESSINTLLERIGKEYSNKVLLQLSFEVTGWAVKDGFLYNENGNGDVIKPIDINNYTELYDIIKTEINDNNIELTELIHYDEEYQNPYMQYYNVTDDVQYYIWYENSRSIIEKIKLANKYDLAGISLWRIGTIPNYYDKSGKEIGFDVWNKINDVINK